MRRTAILAAIVSIFGITSSEGPASAAGVLLPAYVTQCAVATGSITGGFATVSACFDNGGTLAGVAPNAPTFDPGTASACIAMLTNLGFTYGCGDIPTSGVSVDPGLASGSMNFSLPSQTDAGVLTASVTLTGVGDHRFGLSAGPYLYGTPAVPVVTATVGAYGFLDRSITVNPGSVVSSTTLGGGTLAADQGGGMLEGFSTGIQVTIP